MNSIEQRLTKLEAKAATTKGGSVTFIEGKDGTIDEIRQLTEDAIRSRRGMVLLCTDSEPSQPWPTSNATAVIHFDIEDARL